MSDKKCYIVRSGFGSGGGYVCNAETLKLVGNRNNPSDAALCAVRMPLVEASKVRDRMDARGLSTELIKLQFGRVSRGV